MNGKDARLIISIYLKVLVSLFKRGNKLFTYKKKKPVGITTILTDDADQKQKPPSDTRPKGWVKTGSS